MGVEAVQEGAQPTALGERCGPGLTVWGWLVRKSIMQAHVRERRHSESSFVMRTSGVIVLKAEL